jgi:hypothetical protein
MLQYEKHTQKEWMFQYGHIYFWVLKQTGHVFISLQRVGGQSGGGGGVDV